MSVTPSFLVEAAYNFYHDKTNLWLERVGTDMDFLGSFVMPTITFETPPELTVDFGTFTRPTAPIPPSIPAVSVTLPVAPTLTDITIATADAAPTEPAALATVDYSKPSAPNAPLPARPSDTDVVLDAVVVPDAPTYSLPTEPTLYTIELPAVPDLTVPAFDGVRPDMVLDLPQQTFAWQAQQYDMTVIDSVKAQLSNIRLNGLALPADIQAAIFDQNRGREDVLSLQALQDVTDALAASGVRQPSGLLARGRDRVLSQSRQRTSASNRELSIGIAKENIEAIKTAIAAAISLEIALVQNNTQQNDQSLRAAQIGQQVIIDLFNAKVALHNAQWEGFKADAQVFLARIQALQAEADVYKSQIDAQKVIGDVNESLVRSYSERMRALGVLVDIYKTNVDAARAKGELNTQKLEQARLRIQVYDADLSAWSKQWDGYKTQVDAELGSVQAYEALGNVYGKRIDAWSTKRKSQLDETRIQIEKDVQVLERYKASLTGAQIDSQVQLAAVDALLRKYGVDGTIFAAQAQVSAAESAAHDRTAELRIEAARLGVDVAKSNNELRGNYALKAVELAIETVRGRAQISAQVASSLLSGVNFGASINGSLSVNNGYSVSYSGDAEQAPIWPLINNI